MSTPVLVLIVVGSVVVLGLVLVLIVRAGTRKAPARACPHCRASLMPQWDRCMFCGWAPAARLDFILGPLAGQSVELREDVTTVGSVAGNTIVLADPAVSRKHVGIRRLENSYEVADLGSTNGIYVNGHRMPKKTLTAGDVIRVGNSELVFRRD